jgi:hypothetical protein
LFISYPQPIPYTYFPRPKNPIKEKKSTHAYVAGLFKVKQREMIVQEGEQLLENRRIVYRLVT